MRTHIVLLFASTLIAASARAADALPVVQVPESVTAVVSGGSWQHAGAHGIFRVVVTSQGFEHVTSQVFLEWLTEATSTTNRSLEQTIPLSEINTAGIWALGTPQLKVSKSGTEAVLTGSNSYAPSQRIACRVKLLPEGGYRVLSGCKAG